MSLNVQVTENDIVDFLEKKSKEDSNILLAEDSFIKESKLHFLVRIMFPKGVHVQRCFLCDEGIYIPQYFSLNHDKISIKRLYACWFNKDVRILCCSCVKALKKIKYLKRWKGRRYEKERKDTVKYVIERFITNDNNLVESTLNKIIECKLDR